MKKKNDLLTLFGEQLKYLRKERNISQEELAFRAELDRTYISGLECGKRNPTLKILVKLATSFNMELSEMLKKINIHNENSNAKNK